MIGYDKLMECGRMLWLLLTSFFALSHLLKSLLSFFFCMATLRNAQTKIAIMYMREQTCGARDDMIPIRYGMYAMEGVDQ